MNAIRKMRTLYIRKSVELVFCASLCFSLFSCLSPCGRGSIDDFRQTLYYAVLESNVKSAKNFIKTDVRLMTNAEDPYYTHWEQEK